MKDVEYPRKYGDYTVAVHRDQIPETVEVYGEDIMEYRG